MFSSTRKYFESFWGIIGGSKLWMCAGSSVEKNLWSRHHRLIHLLLWRYSSPNSWYSLYREEPLMTLVIANAAMIYITRNSPSDVFLRKDVLKICSKYTGEHPCRSAISIKSLCNFIEIALRHGCSPVNLLHIIRTPFHKNTAGGLLLYCSDSILCESNGFS